MILRLIISYCLLFSFSAAYVPNHISWVRRYLSFLKSTKEGARTKNNNYYNVVSTTPSSTVQQEQQLEYAIGEALWKMKVIQEDPRFLPARPPSLQNLFQTCKESVHVASSSIPAAGNGLFASKYIPAGSIFSFYPVHTLGVNFADGTTYLHGGSKYDNDDYINSVYVMSLIGNRPILGLDLQSDDWKNGHLRGFIDADPSRPIEPAWQCHKINDGACIEKTTTTTTNTKDDVMKYYAASLKAQNAVLVPFGPAPMVVAVATKDIAQGQEIFTCYGRAYWLGVVDPDNSNDSLWNSTTMSSSAEDIVLIEKKIGQVFNQVTNHIEFVYAQEEMELFEAFDDIA